MINLNDFTPVDLGNGPCSITLTLNSIIFSRGLLERLRRPDFIRVSLNLDCKQLIIISTDSNDPFAVDMSRIPFRGRINNRDFVKRLKTALHFKEDETVKINGIYIPEQDLVLFDLNQAVVLISEI